MTNRSAQESDSDDGNDDGTFFDAGERVVKTESDGNGGLFVTTPPPSARRRRAETVPVGPTGSPSRRKRSRRA